MSKYTVFLTYNILSGSDDDNIIDFGESIHCNNIQKFEVDDIEQKNISFYFNNIDEFKFLNKTYKITQINAIIQIINNDLYDDDQNITPIYNEWKKIDVTSQILLTGSTITALDILNTVFKISYSEYENAIFYNLEYLSYPTNTDKSNLSFGNETFFFGNVTTNIEAIAYTTDIPITLPLGEFNQTTNPTWNGNTEVLISEIGIYDDNNNLVAIGKLNTPISKSESIGRTIVFAVDF